MRKRAGEYIKTAAEVYCLLLFVLLPLYMRNGYIGIGDVKYQFFRNVTLLFFLLLSVLQLLWFAAGRIKPEHNKSEHCKSEHKKSGHSSFILPEKLSRTDIMALAYAIVSVLSFCFGMDHHTAFFGFSGWYMGLLSQLMFVWIYFALSRWFSYSKKIIWESFLGAALVMGLAILNRYVFDPLGVFQGMEQGVWNREHLLSTIGNQNWYCGYVSVAAAICFFGGYQGKGAMRAAGLCGCLLTFGTVLTQGSESGYLIPLAMLAVLFVDALDDRKRFLRFCTVLLCCPGAALLGVEGIQIRGLMLVEDGSIRKLLFWRGWRAVFLILCGILLFLFFREKQGKADLLKSGKVKRITLAVSGALLAAGMMIFILCQISDTVWIALGEHSLLRFTDDWGNSRGALWRMSWECFMQSNWWRKLFGAGPDCFYHALYSVYAVNDVIHPTGQWETAVYANAHNEWLNMLINQGILGLVCYAGIFGTSLVRLWRFRRKRPEVYWGVLAAAGYCIHGIVSFQQTISTPLIFAVLGISEGLLRGEAGQMDEKTVAAAAEADKAAEGERI